MKSGFRRTKRVTDPFDAEAKARIVGPDYVSSGSDDSPSLSEIFFGFHAGDAAESSPESGGDSDCEQDRSMCEPSCASADLNLIKPIFLLDRNDAFRSVLRAHVLNAVRIFACARSSKETVRRNVMAYLRNCGYNAAVCRTEWQSCGGLAAGSYEFVDVVRMETSARYFIDLDFAAEFEIARPTASYERLLQQLPKFFVGGEEDLKQILRAASDGARRSMKSGGLHLPPWRKHRFMQNKWLGPHRRTTNVFPASFSSPSPAQRSYSVKCRAVGFNADGRLLFPATARTR